MRRSSMHLAVWAAMAAFVLIGCSSDGGGAGGGSAASQYNQDTPKGTVSKMFAAMESGDKAAFVSCFKAADNQKEFVESTFAMGNAMLDFQKELVKAYGEEAVAKLKQGNGPMKGSLDVDWKAELDKATVDVQGDTATVTMPDSEGKDNPKLVKEDGKWYIDASEMNVPESEEERAMAKKMMSGMAEAINTVKARIGKEGETPESIQKQLGAEMMKVMFGAMGDAMGKGMQPPPAPEQ